MRYAVAFASASIGLLGIIHQQTSIAQTMALPDKIEVSSSGAATYSIPIVVPPGTGGMHPKITLDYNSQGGNGIAGVGWTIGGLLSISRCPQTPAQDGAGHRYSVAIWPSDRFCVDGQRLDAITTGDPGHPGAEYRIEREAFTKVTGADWYGAGVSKFTAWTKDGQTMDFAHTTDSKIEVDNRSTLRVWPVNKIRDTASNYMDVVYGKDKPSSDFWPTRINYTGNTAKGLSPYASVRFEYTDRSDTVRQYAAGSPVRTLKRLSKIKTYVGETQVSEYRLTYDTSPASQRPRLTSLQLCDASSNCLPATTFAYENGGFTTTGGLSFTKTTNGLPVNRLKDFGYVYFGDWNGDGITDMMAWQQGSGNNRWFISNTTTGVAVNFSVHLNPITPGNINDGKPLVFGDWNGDGATDMLWWDGNGTNRWFISNRAAGGTLTFTMYEDKIVPGNINENSGEEIIMPADLNGDGITDVVWFDPNSGKNRWFINHGMTPSSQYLHFVDEPIASSALNGGQLYLGDWDADGVMDVLWFNPSTGRNRWYVNFNAGNLWYIGFSPVIEDPIQPTAINDGTLYFGDWNDDGVTDLVFWNKNNGQNRWFINKGIFFDGTTRSLAFVNYVDPITPSSINSGDGIFFGDWNGDGITDAMWWKKSSGANRWYVSNGGAGSGLAFTLYDNAIPNVDVSGNDAGVEGGNGTQFVDWNGDGLPDVMWWKKNTGENRWFMNNAAKPDLLKTITSGIGRTTTIQYNRLTKGAPFYTRDTNAVRPTVDYSGPVYVVERIERGDGIGGVQASTYRYAGAKIDTNGRGSLGYRTMTVRDEQTGLEQLTTYRQDWPYTGLISSVVKTLGGVELNRVENTFVADSLTGIRKYVKLSQSVEQSRDLNGTVLPTVTTTYQYDAFGNATQTVVTTGDGYSKTTVNTYTNDQVNWLLGRLTRKTVTSVTP